LAAFLVDTNLLVYAYDLADPAKTRRARDCIRRLGESRNRALSAQVLGEFRRPHAAFAAATETVRGIDSRDSPLARVACLGAHRHNSPRGNARGGGVPISVLGRLGMATAKLNGVPNVLTEDLPSGKHVEGIRFGNPFVDEFDLSYLD
jgi:predicted nucleic acid-binding protein